MNSIYVKESLNFNKTFTLHLGTWAKTKTKTKIRCEVVQCNFKLSPIRHENKNSCDITFRSNMILCLLLMSNMVWAGKDV